MERYLALVQEGDAAPVFVLNKADIANNLKARLDQITAIAADVPVYAMSARQTDDIAQLEHHFVNNATVALVASSGVGQSTITNQLLGQTLQATQAVSSYDQRGRHTTHRQFFLPVPLAA
jgi:ribosome biogenesis GTPase / thiamine phosphate phosphatase